MLDPISANDAVISTAGHILGTTNIEYTSGKLKAIFDRVGGCPVNKRIPTIMSRSAFRKVCLSYQKRAGKVTATNSFGKFKKTYGHTCGDGECCIGRHVTAGERFHAPPGVTFRDLARIERESMKKGRLA